MIVKPCPYLEGAVHEYPDDWVFGGADGQHPAADPRYKAFNYTYYDENAQPIWVTSSPTCHDQAIDEFTFVAGFGPDWNPKWLSVRHPDGHEEMFKLVYDKATDTVLETIP